VAYIFTRVAGFGRPEARAESRPEKCHTRIQARGRFAMWALGFYPPPCRRMSLAFCLVPEGRMEMTRYSPASFHDTISAREESTR
jgi:hypothetical protein